MFFSRYCKLLLSSGHVFQNFWVQKRVGIDAIEKIQVIPLCKWDLKSGKLVGQPIEQALDILQ